MRSPKVDWRRVARVLHARELDEVVTCPRCKDQGTIPYIAEHVLKTHPASREATTIQKLVLGDSSRSA